MQGQQVAKVDIFYCSSLDCEALSGIAKGND